MVIKKTFRFKFTYYYFSIPERLESSTWEKNNRTSCCHHDYVKNTRQPLAKFQTKCFIHEITQSQPSRPPISKFPQQGNDKLNVIILVTEFCSGGCYRDLRLYYTFLSLGREKEGGLTIHPSIYVFTGTMCNSCGCVFWCSKIMWWRAVVLNEVGT